MIAEAQGDFGFGQGVGDTSGSEPAALTELRQGASPDLENTAGDADED